MNEAVIRTLAAAEAVSRLDELSAILMDAVTHGASVNFMAGLTADDATAFWQGQFPGLVDLSRYLFVAELGNRLVGTAVLTYAHQPNAPHRAELNKMLVLSSARRRGLGSRLLTAAEDAALAAGRTLLLLDTETGSGGDKLYRSFGWTEIGTVPNHAFRPNGQLAETTMFYKRLGPPA